MAVVERVRLSPGHEEYEEVYNCKYVLLFSSINSKVIEINNVTESYPCSLQCSMRRM